MTASNWIAIYGAVVSTIVLIWNLYTHYNNKGSLKIKVALIKDCGHYTEDVGVGTHSRLFRFDVVNKGKQALTITSIGGMTKRPKLIDFWRKLPRFQIQFSKDYLSFPYTIEPTKTSCWMYDFPSLEHLGKISKIYVQDSSGKFWYAPRKKIKKITAIIAAMK